VQLRVQRVRDGALARELVAPPVFVIAILASNYLLTALPNVKLFDLLVFAAGYSLGVRRGATVAIAAWYFYGQANPFGPAQASLLATLMASETGYAILGGLVRRVVPPSGLSLGSAWSSVLLVGAALIATSGFDLATNVYTGYFWASLAGSQDYSRWIWTAVSNPGALFFMLVHVGSNAVLFPVFVPLVVKGVEGAKGRWGLS
jgi:hypothetical protein